MKNNNNNINAGIPMYHPHSEHDLCYRSIYGWIGTESHLDRSLGVWPGTLPQAIQYMNGLKAYAESAPWAWNQDDEPTVLAGFTEDYYVLEREIGGYISMEDCDSAECFEQGLAHWSYGIKERMLVPRGPQRQQIRCEELLQALKSACRDPKRVSWSPTQAPTDEEIQTLRLEDFVDGEELCYSKVKLAWNGIGFALKLE